VTVVIVVAGLAALTSQRTGTDNNDPLSPTGLSGTQLSEATDLASSDWVAASALPDEVEWLYPLTPPRVVWYGSRSQDGVSRELRISVGGRSVPDGESVEIAETTWTINTDNPGQWHATRQLPSTIVTVTGAGNFDQIDRDLIGALIVVPESALPSPPLGDPARDVEVARIDLDETSYSFFAQESNGFWCNVLRTNDEESPNDLENGSGGCGLTLEPSSPIAVGGGEASTSGGASTSRAARAGSVTEDAARVDVEFIDGTVVSITPIDLSEQFDRKFWIAVANIGPDPQTGLPATAETVTEVRAYDDNNQLIATATAPFNQTGLRQDLNIGVEPESVGEE
jgi:hypothetical protein